MFGDGQVEARKRAAIALAEQCGCSVIFVGGDSAFVSFTRKRDRLPRDLPSEMA
jgi:hypothetical protein